MGRSSNGLFKNAERSTMRYDNFMQRFRFVMFINARRNAARQAAWLLPAIYGPQSPRFRLRSGGESWNRHGRSRVRRRQRRAALLRDESRRCGDRLSLIGCLPVTYSAIAHPRPLAIIGRAVAERGLWISCDHSALMLAAWITLKLTNGWDIREHFQSGSGGHAEWSQFTGPDILY